MRARRTRGGIGVGGIEILLEGIQGLMTFTPIDLKVDSKESRTHVLLLSNKVYISVTHPFPCF
jgi:hypothetical protein